MGSSRTARRIQITPAFALYSRTTVVYYCSVHDALSNKVIACLHTPSRNTHYRAPVWRRARIHNPRPPCTPRCFVQHAPEGVKGFPSSLRSVDIFLLMFVRPLAHPFFTCLLRPVSSLSAHSALFVGLRPPSLASSFPCVLLPLRPPPPAAPASLCSLGSSAPLAECY